MMIELPMDYTKQLWAETPEHNWVALQEMVERHAEKADAGQRILDEVLLAAINRLMQFNRPFPDTPEMLHDLLVSEMKVGALRKARYAPRQDS